MIAKTYMFLCPECRIAMRSPRGARDCGEKIIIESVGVIDSANPVQSGISVSSCKHCHLLEGAEKRESSIVVKRYFADQDPNGRWWILNVEHRDEWSALKSSPEVFTQSFWRTEYGSRIARDGLRGVTFEKVEELT